MELIDYLNSTGQFIYTGIGSREIPITICDLISGIASNLEARGAILRSGGANGADLAFENGIRSDFNKFIYLPWCGFNNSPSKLCGETAYDEEATKIASEIHPAWDRCSDAAKKLHMRNVFQILGYSLDNPSKFVLFYADEKNGKVQGGTATAVNLARKYNVPTFNIKEDKNLLVCWEYVGKRIEKKQTFHREHQGIWDFGF